MAIKSDTRVARRYAAALFEAVSSQTGSGGVEGIEAASADLEVVEHMLKNVPYLRAVLQQPLVSDERKRKVVTDAFQSRLGPVTLNFLSLLIRKRRENLIEECIVEFRRLANERAGRIDAFVEAPQELTGDQMKRLRESLEQRTGKTVHMHMTIDPRMLGGVRVRIGDDVIDAGLRSRLERLRLRMLAAR